jgi:murein L,D-transpeptidase YcbB/YkuD
MVSEALAALLRDMAPSPARPAAVVAALRGFYGETAPQPRWVGASDWNATGRRLVSRLADVAGDGLDPDDYRLPGRLLLAGEPAVAARAFALAELQLTEALLRFAREVQAGRVAPSRVSPLITLAPEVPEPAGVLSLLAAADDPVQALEGFHPPHAGYHWLRQRLRQMLAENAVPLAVRIPGGPTLRLGMQDSRVPLLRLRLGLDPAGEDAAVYDRSVAVRVAAFQKASGLAADGTLNAPTLAALSGERVPAQVAEIVANMERWRWLPRDLGQRHVFVNVPDMEVTLVEAGAVTFRSRAIVGKDETQTPIFSDVMDHVVLNPSWTIPPGILKRNPKYLDPEYAARHGYQISERNGRITVRQPPGSDNALGMIKFMFPNDHAVYLHDTPGRHLFAAGNRMLSNGCVRVENPFRLAERLFGSGSPWTERRFRSLVGQGERTLRLPQPLPVHLAYFTLTADEHGDLRSSPDIYGHSRRLRGLLQR